MQFTLKTIAVVASLLPFAASVPVDPATGSAVALDDYSPANVTNPVQIGEVNDDGFDESADFDDDDEEDDNDPIAGWLLTGDVTQVGGPNNPISGEIDCTGIEELCDANCYAILCLNRPSLLQRGQGTASANKRRREAGVKGQPFKGDAAKLKKRGVRRPGSQYVSAEEYPFASTEQGGRGADLFPARESEQNTQKFRIKSMYDTNGIQKGSYFNLGFKNANTVYCNALKNKDYSVCGKKKRKGPGGFDYGKYAFVKDSLGGSSLHFASVGKV